MRIWTFCLAVLALVVPAGTACAGPIVNGNFELGYAGFTTQYTYTTNLSAPRTFFVGIDPHRYNSRAVSYTDHTSGFGRMLIANGAAETDVTVWQQTVSVTPNKQYVFCYWLSPRAFSILLGFQLRMIGQEAAPILELRNYLTFFLRLLLIFGAMFELPLVLMFLSAVGIVKSEFLAKHWRIAVVAMAVVGAIVTPTPDAVTLSFLLGPMIALYVLSIFLSRLGEKGRRKHAQETAPSGTTPPTEPAPDPYAVYRPEEAAGTEAPEAEEPAAVEADAATEAEPASEAAADAPGDEAPTEDTEDEV